METENIASSPAVSWTAATGEELIADMEKKSLLRANMLFNWYVKTKKRKGKASRTIRCFCIILFTLSAIVPLINASGGTVFKNMLPNLGYILAAFGAGLLFLERFYGFSTGWVRTNRTVTELGDTIRNFTFLMQTVTHLNPANTPEGFQVLSDAIRTFNENISAILKVETSDWEKEFQAGNEELQKYFKDQVEEQKPGDLQIKVANYATFETVEIFINDINKGFITGGSRLFRSFTPGNYEVKIKTNLLATHFVANQTDVAIVKPGVIAVLNF